MRKRYLAALLLIISLGLAACDHLAMQQLVDPPIVEVVGMTVDAVSADEATVVFSFQLGNTNPMSMETSQIKYNLHLNGRKFVKGISRQRVKIPVIGESEVVLPVTFTFTDLLGPSGATTDGIPYELTGNVVVGPFAIPYEYSGRMTLDRNNGAG